MGTVKNRATGINHKKAAKEFAAEWKGKGYEKGESQKFWLELLQKVFGVDDVYNFISFENRVKLNRTSFIDAYISNTHVLIEQKSINIDLKAQVQGKQAGSKVISPFAQALQYNNELKYSDKARWIVLCNFKEFHVYDMETLNPIPEIIKLSDLPKDYHRLRFLVDNTATNIKEEEKVSIEAGKIVGVLHDKFLNAYIDPSDPKSQKDLNKLCVRLVFCLYAEDAGIFGAKNMFHDYMSKYPVPEFREKLIKLFEVLDTKYKERDGYMDESLKAFPYVNGGLFSGDIEIPHINEETRSLILQRASNNFDWSEISPTIFGAVFESTLNPETRRGGGMHYTSIENIHKLIDPLFLNDLKAELKAVKFAQRQKIEKATALQTKLASLTFFDPACGSGNFLTETYISLRRIENELIRIRFEKNPFIPGTPSPIRVSINQFYGIEINDFACSVAQTALWIAESQMMQETIHVIGHNLDPLPLKKYTNIHEGNALRTKWDEVVPVAKLSYIIGNPPFSGARIMTNEQKDDLQTVFGAKWKNLGNMDYVTGWYKKSQELMVQNPNIKAALVSTNSITQGEQVANLWKPLIAEGVHIDFAWRTFVWNSEANQKAHVHCVIVGFSTGAATGKLKIFDGKDIHEAKNINGYLIDDENVFVESRSKPLCPVPEIGIGNKPIDGGYYLFTDEEKADFVKKEPASDKYFKRWFGSDEFINQRPRWCLWLGDAKPTDLLKLPECMKRIEAVRKFRLKSKSIGTVKLADRPTRFHVENMPKGNYLLIPRVSSEKRTYIPIGFMSHEMLSSDSAHIIPNASLYHFGVLTSSTHNIWMRTVCGRLESRYRYSKDIVYNNFPWAKVSEKQHEKIEQTAQAILDARNKYPKATLADMYGKMYLFPELLKAHRDNDAAVTEAYGFDKDLDESQIITLLFQRYQKLAKQP